MKKIAFILISLALGSCASDYYALNKFRNVQYATIAGYRAENPLTVYPIADDALKIEQNSSTAIRKYDAVQYEKSFILKKLSGGTFSITERTSPLEPDKTTGLKMQFSDNGFALYENDKEIASDHSVTLQTGEKHLFRIIQDGDYTTTIIDCDTIAKVKTSIPASEYTIFRTGEGTEIEIYSLDVIDLYDNSDKFVEMWKKN
jgi:hypothetical protein